MPFTPENDLERALLAPREGRLAIGDFFNLLWDAELLMPRITGEEREGGTSVSLPAITGPDDRSHLPFFTSARRLEDFSEPEALRVRCYIETWARSRDDPNCPQRHRAGLTNDPPLRLCSRAYIRYTYLWVRRCENEFETVLASPGVTGSRRGGGQRLGDHGLLLAAADHHQRE